ncbi:MAG: universal stress protein [Candidatus Nitrosotenuis sp.]
MLYTVKKILVPIDGSANSYRALDVAMMLAKTLKAKLVGIHAINIIPTTESQPFEPLEFQLEEKRHATAMLETVRALCNKEGISFSAVVGFGSPGDLVVKFVKNKDNKIDMVVIGSRGKTAISEIFLGSVSNFVLHKSPIPVLVVK